METKELINYVYDNEIEVSSKWFFHATDLDVDKIERILKEGILSSCLRSEKSYGGYNGKYYVSVSKKTSAPRSAYKSFKYLPKLILEGIKPIKADNKNTFFHMFYRNCSSF